MVITRNIENVKKKVVVKTSRSKSTWLRKKLPKPLKTFTIRGSRSSSVKDFSSPDYMQWSVQSNSSNYSIDIHNINLKSNLTDNASIASSIKVSPALSKKSSFKQRKVKKFKPLFKSVSQQLRSNVVIHRVKQSLTTIPKNNEDNSNINESKIEFSDISGSNLEFSDLSKADDSDTSEVAKEEPDISRTDRTFENFLETYQKLPNLDELSVSSFHDDLQSEYASEMKTSSAKSDSFHFSSSDFEHFEDENIYQEENQTQQLDILSFSSSEFEDDEDVEVDDNDDDAVDELNNLPQKDLELIEDKDEMVDFLEQFKSAKQSESDDHKLGLIDDTEKHISKFLDEIIKRIVLASERKPYLYKMLDKKKLHEHLRQEVSNYKEEFAFNFLLNKYVTELNVRRGNYSRVKPINDEKYNKYIGMRFSSALCQVDYWLKREVESEGVRFAEVQKLAEEEKLKRFQADQMVEKFKDLVYDTILKRFDRSDRLKQLVNNLMTKMDEIRYQISVERSHLIWEQNTFATLKMQLEEIDTIGHGLKTQHFLSVQEEVKMLKCKLEAQNNEYKRLYSNLNTYAYSKSHMRCYSKLLRSNLERSNMSLQMKLYNFSELQNQFYKDNQKHLRIYKEIQLVKEQSGIMHYPLLMKDYDETMKHLHRKRFQVNELKIQYNKLLKKLARVDKNQRPTRSYSIISFERFKT